jgi:hypothetical protein
VPPNVRTPNPAPSRPAASVPSRASFQLPAVDQPAAPPKSSPGAAPARPASGGAPKLPTRATTTGKPATARPARDAKPVAVEEEEPAWADETSERKNSFGPVGLVAAALLIMVVVYYTATLVMR